MKLKTELGADFLERFSKSKRPLPALSELTWNALDGDATVVEVTFHRNGLESIESVEVADNGHGISRKRAEETFGMLGSSWKQTAKTSESGRLLHGHKGEGRFAAFALGSHATWMSRTSSSEGEHCISIEGRGDAAASFGVFELTEDPADAPVSTGTTVLVSGVTTQAANALDGDELRDRLAKTFAPYLMKYSGVSIRVDGGDLDPSPFVVQTKTYEVVASAVEGSEPVEAQLTVIEWARGFGREIVLCDEHGFPLAVQPGGIRSPGFDWTAYLSSGVIRECDERNLLETSLSPSLEALLKQARTRLRAHFRERSVELTKGVVSTWKEEDVYPYKGEPADAVETVERQVFDVVALNVNEYLPSFGSSDAKAKRLSLRMLKTALESSPHEVQKLVQEVLDLPEDKREELSELLEYTTLSAVINAARLVADRLNFLSGLEAVLFEPELKRHTKERAHLHRLIAENTWVFGEEFHLTVDDESLTQVLRRHKEKLGRGEDEELDPVTRLDGTKSIVDVMISRAVPLPGGRGNEHLVIELKRPSKRIDSTVATQIESYAFAVIDDDRFRDTNTRWEFWALSNDMDDHVRYRAGQKDRPPGVIFEHDRFRIWVKTWGQVIEESRARLRLFGEQLDYMATKDRGLEYLRETHAKYVPDQARELVEEDSSPESSS